MRGTLNNSSMLAESALASRSRTATLRLPEPLGASRKCNYLLMLARTRAYCGVSAKSAIRRSGDLLSVRRAAAQHERNTPSIIARNVEE